jgi:two-component system cell cycle response regulator DivK
MKADPPSAPAPVVLVVDDDDRNRKLARDVLRAAGLETLEAASGREALALAAQCRPDVILLDLGLPDMSGIDVAGELGRGERTAGIAVVALSALSDVGGRAWLLEAGFAGLLAKPIDVRAFPEQVRGYARNRASIPIDGEAAR